MKTDAKQRVTIWMPPTIIGMVDRLLTEDSAASRSAFVCNAVRFYGGYLQSKNCEDYITKGVLGELKFQLAQHQKNICSTLFKLAVEISMSMHVTAEISEMGRSYLGELRKKSISDVKKSLGRVRFDSIYEYHEGLNPPVDEENGEE